MNFVYVILCICVAISNKCLAKQPNIVFILTDDQDKELGGMTPLVKTMSMLGEQGMTFDNMFVTTPVCCPSRSSIFTGKYQHNHLAINNTIEGNCSSVYWQQNQEVNAFPVKLKEQGYTNFFAGKYLNMYGLDGAGGVEHVPPGWDTWIGLVGNSVYYNYTLSVNGQAEQHGHNYASDYLTDLIHRNAMDFLADKTNESAPFFVMMSTPSCHDPFEPAPQYENFFSDVSAPRTASFNKHGLGKHWLIESAVTPMSNSTIAYVDDVFKRRWQTLKSVDDMVSDVVNYLDSKHLLDNTYIFFSSDNGYHLGQFSMPTDKRLIYEFDVRVPLIVRGPGVPSGVNNQENVLNIDLAPTFLELAGGTPPDDMDGMSLSPLLHGTRNDDSPFRPEFLTEYHGEHQDINYDCPQYNGQGMAWCKQMTGCVCEDVWNNTYTCIRKKDATQDVKFCQFQDNDNFQEMYDLSKDHFELMNIAKSHPEEASKLRDDLNTLMHCAGASCNLHTSVHNKHL